MTPAWRELPLRPRGTRGRERLHQGPRRHEGRSGGAPIGKPGASFEPVAHMGRSRGEQVVGRIRASGRLVQPACDDVRSVDTRRKHVAVVRRVELRRTEPAANMGLDRVPRQPGWPRVVSVVPRAAERVVLGPHGQARSDRIPVDVGDGGAPMGRRRDRRHAATTAEQGAIALQPPVEAPRIGGEEKAQVARKVTWRAAEKEVAVVRQDRVGVQLRASACRQACQLLQKPIDVACAREHRPPPDAALHDVKPAASRPVPVGRRLGSVRVTPWSLAPRSRRPPGRHRLRSPVGRPGPALRCRGSMAHP